ncbi:MAG: Hpt domain-containing protein, partial [Nitrospirota bacterium]|nr:Hpt domain-containing protein [Nitrospirota bacterium]
HGLKGISGNIGALRLQYAAAKLERQGYDGKLPERDVVLSSLEKEFARAQEALENECRQVMDP